MVDIIQYKYKYKYKYPSQSHTCTILLYMGHVHPWFGLGWVKKFRPMYSSKLFKMSF